MNPLSFIAPAAAIAALVALLGGVAVWAHEHDAKVIAQVAAQQAVVAAEAQHEQDRQTIAGLTVAAQKAAARASTMTKLKETIHATTSTSACANAPAIHALLTGLRGTPDGGDARPTPTTAGRSVGLPSPAGASAGR